MQLVASLGRLIAPASILDLGCGLGYSTLWLASIVEPGGRVIGIDDDPDHVGEATNIADQLGYADRVEYRCGRVADVLGDINEAVDMIHDDAWFAARPAHLDAMVGLVRPGGLLTMVNWFLLVDAIYGSPRNDWESFAGEGWAAALTQYAHELAARSDLDITWLRKTPDRIRDPAVAAPRISSGSPLAVVPFGAVKWTSAACRYAHLVERGGDRLWEAASMCGGFVQHDPAGRITNVRAAD